MQIRYGTAACKKWDTNSLFKLFSFLASYFGNWLLLNYILHRSCLYSVPSRWHMLYLEYTVQIYSEGGVVRVPTVTSDHSAGILLTSMLRMPSGVRRKRRHRLAMSASSSGNSTTTATNP